jgi:hypothetical protein
MPVKVRVAKALRPVLSDEVIELFAELELAEQNPRVAPELQAQSRELAQMLGLLDEWYCAVCHVNDAGPTSGYPEGHLTNDAFLRVRAVREALLAACAERAGDHNWAFPAAAKTVEPVTKNVTENRGRGRPPSDSAMTAAERKRKQRERKRDPGGDPAPAA